MKEQTGDFRGANGCRLFHRASPPERAPRAALALVHGSGEHSGRYRNLVEPLVGAGFLVAGFDLRGHGRSEGQRGHVDSWDDYREDLRAFLSLASSLAPGGRLFLFGHSIGSAIALEYALRDPAGLAGVACSGTPLEPKQGAPWHLVLIARALSRVWPRFSLKVKLAGSQLSRDPAVAQAYEDDALVHRDRTVRWGAECLRAIDWIKQRPTEVRLPSLFLHGQRDPLVSAAGVERFFDAIPHGDKTLQVYPDGLHEPHNDLEHPRVVADLESWMSRLLAG